MIIQENMSNKIKTLVDVIWYIDENGLSESKQYDRIAPTGHIHIVYNFGDPCYINNGKQWVPLPNIALFGQYKEALEVKYGNHVRQIGLAINPASFYIQFNLHAGLYSGAIIDARKIPAFHELNTQIESIVDQSNDAKDIISVIKVFLLELVKEIDQKDIINDMMNYVDVYDGNIDISLMAKKFSYSISALERKFKKYVGLTPKAYASIIRFRKAMLADNPIDVYYDQSHFIKNCKNYTGKLMNDHDDCLTLKYILGLDNSTS